MLVSRWYCWIIKNSLKNRIEWINYFIHSSTVVSPGRNIKHPINFKTKVILMMRRMMLMMIITMIVILDNDNISFPLYIFICLFVHYLFMYYSFSYVVIYSITWFIYSFINSCTIDSDYYIAEHVLLFDNADDLLKPTSLAKDHFRNMLTQSLGCLNHNIKIIITSRWVFTRGITRLKLSQ